MTMLKIWLFVVNLILKSSLMSQWSLIYNAKIAFCFKWPFLVGLWIFEIQRNRRQLCPIWKYHNDSHNDLRVLPMCHSFDISALDVLFFDPSNMLLNCLGKESQFPSQVVLQGNMHGHVTYSLSAHDQHWCVRRGTIPLCCSLFFGKL